MFVGGIDRKRNVILIGFSHMDGIFIQSLPRVFHHPSQTKPPNDCPFPCLSVYSAAKHDPGSHYFSLSTHSRPQKSSIIIIIISDVVVICNDDDYDDDQDVPVPVAIAVGWLVVFLPLVSFEFELGTESNLLNEINTRDSRLIIM